jgi:DNA polymerase-3 subunit epsilon
VSGINFTAIDVETANSNRGSICAVGMAQVRDGQIIKAIEWHVRLPDGMGTFAQSNIDIHGITAEMVKNANNWEESLEAIQFLAEGFPLVAYNAPFDSSAMRQASEFAGLGTPGNAFHCALELSRRLIALESYKLPDVASALSADPFEHHSPGADAVACAQVVLALAKQENTQSLSDLWSPATARYAINKRRNSSFAENRSRIADLPQPHPDASPDHPFFGRQVIITGGLETYSRSGAMELIARHGGTNGNGITKRTRFLVVGGVSSIGPPSTLVGSSKERKAAAYIEQGQDLQVITEHEFLQLVGAPERNTEPLTLQRSQTTPPITESTPPSDTGLSSRENTASLPRETRKDSLRREALPPLPKQPLPAPVEKHNVEDPAPSQPSQSPPVVLTRAMETKNPTAALLLVILWVLAVLGAVGALLFGAAGIALFTEGAPGGGWTGIVIGALGAAMAFVSAKGIRKRNRR